MKKGAGVLVLLRDKGLFLLGKDYTKEWADFGGNSDTADRDSWATAVREASEESLGLLSPVLDRSKIKATCEVGNGPYTCYLVDAPTSFSICREFERCASAPGIKAEVTAMLRFPVAKFVESMKKGNTAHCDKESKHVIRERTRLCVLEFVRQGVNFD